MNLAKFRIAFYASLLILTTIDLQAQTGPGGVGSTDGTSDLSLWLDAGRINNINNGDDIAGWSDISGNQNHAKIGTNAPSFSSTGGGNSQPAVNFAAASDQDLIVLADGNNELLPSDALSVFVVGQYDGTNSDAWGAFISTSDDDDWDDGWAIARQGTGNMLSYVNDYTVPICSQTLSTNNEIWSMIYSATAVDYAYLSETSCNTNNITATVNYITGDNDNDELVIGAAWNNDGPVYHLDGTISEVILYDAALNSAQRIIVSNYLAAKYAITLNSNDIYDGDDTGYDFEVAGIGRVDASNIHDDAQGGIVRILNPTLLGNSEFLFWGHDNGALEATETVDVPSGYDGRLERVWRVTEETIAGAATNVGMLDIRFDLSSFTSVFADDLALLIDRDNDGFADEGPIAGAVDLGDGIFEFNGVLGARLQNGFHFTLATSNSDQTTLFDNDLSITGPGGVGGTDGSSNLSLWLDANTIDLGSNGDLSEWEDQSGNGYHAQTVTSQPFYTTTGGGNGMPTVNFDIANSEYMFVSNNAEVMPVNTLSVFVVGTFQNTTGQWGSIISTSDDDAWDDGWGIARDNLNTDVGFYVNDWANRGMRAISFGVNHIWGLTYEDGVNEQGYKSENATTYTATGAINYNGGTNDHLLLGAGTNNGGPAYFLDGNISEVILYDQALNNAQRIIVTNYLSSKYDILLNSNDVFDEDDNGNYDFEVAGIGRVDATNIQSSAKGTGIIQVENPTDLGNDEFFMWGHDNAGVGDTEFADIPDASGVDARLARVWRVSEMSSASVSVDVGAVDITVYLGNEAFPNVDASDLVLLVDSDNDGDFDNTSTTVISSPTDLGGNSFTFSGVTALTDNVRFSIGTTNIINTPLPVELNRFDLIADEHHNVVLSWETLTETNNDFFTVERSLDGRTWVEIAEINGAGNSASPLAYEFVDTDVTNGLIFYRLKQTDFDGQFEYFDVKTISINSSLRNLMIYPNPASDFIHLRGMDHPEYQVLDIRGKNITDQLPMRYQGSEYQLDISNLDGGVYFIQFGTFTKRFVKE